MPVLVVRHSGKAMVVSEASLANGAPIIQWDVFGGSNERFALDPLPDGFHRLIAENSGKVLDVEGASLANGARIIQWDWHGAGHQLWKL